MTATLTINLTITEPAAGMSMVVAAPASPYHVGFQSLSQEAVGATMATYTDPGDTSAQALLHLTGVSTSAALI